MVLTTQSKILNEIQFNQRLSSIHDYWFVSKMEFLRNAIQLKCYSSDLMNNSYISNVTTWTSANRERTLQLL